jgi:alpha-N-arabinofuranosidase
VEQGGIDPSLFFDADGKVYFTSNGTLWAPVRGAYQAEIDLETGRLLTDSTFLWTGTGGAYPEAPHLFKRGEWYYLMMAEGGTAECHMVTVCRSQSPWGPFENSPHHPALSTRSLMNPIQATGHADFIEDHRGNWWAVFLGFRYANNTFHNLGRETFLAPLHWTEDGWPVVNEGKKIALRMETEQGLPAYHWPEDLVRDEFDSTRLGLVWNYLRNPNDSDYSLSARPGWLQLRCAAATLNDLASPSFLGRRQQHFNCTVTALMDFQPKSEGEEAGLTVLIDNRHHYEIAVTLQLGRRVALVRRTVASLQVSSEAFPLPEGPVTLRLRADGMWYHLGLVLTDGTEKILERGEVKFLSSEVAGGYTGAYLGLYATARGTHSTTQATFDWFDYKSAS